MDIKFVPVNKSEIPSRPYKNSQNQRVISKFLESGSEATEIDLEGLKYADDLSAYNSFNRTIKRRGFPVKLLLRKHKLYLVRTDM